MQDPERTSDFGTGPEIRGVAGGVWRRRSVTSGIALAIALAAVVGIRPLLDRPKSVGNESNSGQSLIDGSQVLGQPAVAINGLLQARATAIRDGDRAGWLAVLAPASDTRVTRFRT